MTRLPVAIPLGLAAAMINERLRHSTAPPDAGTEGPGANPLLGLAAAGGVVGALTGAAAVEGAAAQWLSARAAHRAPRFAAALDARHPRGCGRGAGHRCAPAVEPSHAQDRGRDQRRRAGVDTAAVGRGRPDDQRRPRQPRAWEDLGREGRRHALALSGPPRPGPPWRWAPDLSIATVMGEPAVAEPVQVYVGLDSAPTAARAGRPRAGRDGPDRRLGPVAAHARVARPAPATSTTSRSPPPQYLTRGDVAIRHDAVLQAAVAAVAGQGRRRPGAEPAAVAARSSSGCGTVPDRRPRVVLFGESLGAHTSQDVFLHWGTLGPAGAGHRPGAVDRHAVRAAGGCTR